MTDEAREAFQAAHMNPHLGYHCQSCGYARAAWLYYARIALEELGYGITSLNGRYCWWAPAQATRGEVNCHLAIEAGVMDWYERREEQQ